MPILVRADAALEARLKNAVWHVGRGLTVNGVLVRAMERAVAELEEQHNRGEPFPGAGEGGEPARLPAGRKPKPTPVVESPEPPPKRKAARKTMAASEAGEPTPAKPGRKRKGSAAKE